VKRYPVMYNDCVLIGPQSDPAGITGDEGHCGRFPSDQGQGRGVLLARRPVRHASSELNLWKIAGVDIQAEKGPWYKDIGQGMGAALNMAAAAADAYVLSDRGTWLSFGNERDLAIVVEGDRRLFNQYGAILVNPQKHPAVRKELGQQFIDWLISPEGQQAIADYKIGGAQLFYPNASDPNA
jgi:tungstate transport system substrate-binding protein